MELKFRPMEVSDIRELLPWHLLRPDLACESLPLEQYLWKDFYHIEYAVADERALLMKMTWNGRQLASLPICREEDMAYYFQVQRTYFHEKLGIPMNVCLADEAGLACLHLDPAEFAVYEAENAADYVYNVKDLQELKGRRYHTQKGHVNHFVKHYPGRYEYRTLTEADKCLICEYLERWASSKGADMSREPLKSEVAGTFRVIKHLGAADARTAGIFVDGRLEAFTIGSYNPQTRMVIVHVEKANSEINGLYPFINQQFLLREFPGAELVNREDDAGQLSLRAAKQEYHPVMMVKKYTIVERCAEGAYAELAGGRKAEKRNKKAVGGNLH